MRRTGRSRVLLAALLLTALVSRAAAAAAPDAPAGHTPLLQSLFGGSRPPPPPLAPRQSFRDATLSPDTRAAFAMHQLSLDEEIGLVHGDLAMPWHGAPRPHGSIGGAGFVRGVPRLGIPALQESDGGLGVANPMDARPGDTATPLPSGLALAATWSPALARQAGAAIGQEAARKGFNVLLAGDADLVRDPRAGRNFEYAGEDPLLTGTMVGATIAGIQSTHVLATVKHYAMDDQETGRSLTDARIGMRALRESDLLGFEIAIEHGRPGAVMCGRNRTDGAYDCASDVLLNAVLKQDWRYPGFVMSDWGAVHDAAASALAGLDQESGAQLDPQVWFDLPLKQAVLSGAVPRSRLDDMVRRILRSMVAVGLVDHPPVRGPIDAAAGLAVAQAVEEQGAVLLRNVRGALPLDPHLHRLAVIGAHADVGLLSGGGSAQVMPVEGNAVPGSAPTALSGPGPAVYDPSSPLQAIRALAPQAAISFVVGDDAAAAAHAAQGADAAIVFARQWTHEGDDVPDMALPDDQDKLIAAVAAANPCTVVVLETGGPVRMPWLSDTAAVLQAWYPGARGGPALARLLFGQADPSGRLPVSIPVDEHQLPRQEIPGHADPGRDVDADDTIEGQNVGYKWFDSRHIAPQFPFGYGLSYTRFAYRNLHVSLSGTTLVVSFDVRNIGTRDGRDVPQLYLDLPAKVQHDWSEAPKRLIGWQKVSLRAGESKHVSVIADPRLLAVYDDRSEQGGKPGWRIVPGDYIVSLGANAADLALHAPLTLPEARLAR